jgi:hypothetical protein
MTKYATFDTESRLNARYDSTINNAIPDGAIELSDELFWRTINEIDGIWKLVSGEVVKTAIPIPVPLIPQPISRLQALAAMYNGGLLDAAEAYFALPDTPRIQKLAWANAQDFYRQSPLVIAVGAILGLSDAQIDTLFTAGSTIQV